MATLTELKPDEHKDLKIAPGAAINFASQQHVLSLAAIELANAATSFPIFASQNTTNGNWSFTAMTSFELSNNLFVKNEQWEATYQPTCLRTYPLYLMPSAKGGDQYTIGFNAQSDAFSDSQGIALFGDDNKASAHLSDITNALNGELGNLRQTLEFGKTLETLNLLKEVELKVQYQDGTTNLIKGLHTLNEDSFKNLSDDKLAQLNKVGYLTPIHALLISLFNLNALINRNNDLPNKPQVASIKMDDVKGEAQ
jgi:hypothetical protein